MDIVADLVTGVWVDIVATVGAGVVEFTGVIEVVGTGLVSTLTLYFFWQAWFSSFCHLPWVLGPF